eukprot:916826-Prorocentrum_minimum.AAC.1
MMYGVRKELVGELNSRTTRWLNQVLTVHSTVSVLRPTLMTACKLPSGRRSTRCVHPTLLRLVPAPGLSSRPSSDWFPPRVYPPVPPPI